MDYLIPSLPVFKPRPFITFQKSRCWDQNIDTNALLYRRYRHRDSRKIHYSIESPEVFGVKNLGTRSITIRPYYWASAAWSREHHHRALRDRILGRSSRKETLFEFVREHRPSKSEQRELHMTIDETIFAVLDSRSIRDGTVALYHYYWRMPKECFEEDEDAWDPELAFNQWIEWRVKFLTAGRWGSALWFMPDYADFEIDKGTYIDEDGVLQLPHIEYHKNELPGSTEEEKVAWSPEKSLEERRSAWRYAASPFNDLCDAGIIRVHRAVPKKYPN